MRAESRPARIPSTSRRTLALFALAVILPGLFLAGLGLYTLRQDRRLADQQLRERRDLLADRAVTSLTTTLAGWAAAITATPLGEGVEPTALPPSLRAVLEKSDLSAFITVGSAGSRCWPRDRLLYDVAARSPAADSLRVPTPALAAAEKIELQERDLTKAATAYRALLAPSDPQTRATILVRLARVYRNAGRADLAASAYRDLERLAGLRVDGVPVDLLATCALCLDASAAERDICSTRIYSHLVEGTWKLDRVWYHAYSGLLRGVFDARLDRDPELSRLVAKEERRRGLTRAIESVLAEPRTSGSSPWVRTFVSDGQPYFAILAATNAGRRAVVAAADAMARQVWPPVFGELLEEASIAIADASGLRVFPLAPETEPFPAVSGAPIETGRLVDAGGTTLKIALRLRRPDILLSGFQSRQWLYVAMLVVMVASLVVGTALTLRTVSRELAVAQLKSQFVSAVSHEFRTPLTGIRHYGEMLLHDRVATEERKHHYYAQVVGAAERLGRLVEDVLDFARMEEGRHQYRMEDLEPTTWLRQTAAEFEATLEQRARVECAIPEALGVVRGDSSALARVVHNLLDNAVKYSPGCDTVWLDANEDEQGLVMSVRDKGVGIPARDRSHVFERFYRGHDVAASARGTGLGLSLVQHIVSAHGGTVDITSEVGQGTTVTVRLPRGQGSA